MSASLPSRVLFSSLPMYQDVHWNVFPFMGVKVWEKCICSSEKLGEEFDMVAIEEAIERARGVVGGSSLSTALRYSRDINTLYCFKETQLNSANKSNDEAIADTEVDDSAEFEDSSLIRNIHGGGNWSHIRRS